MLLIADDLVILVSLAGHEHHIALLGKHDGRTNGRRAIRDAQVTCPLRHSLLHLIENRLGIFVARVVGGENRRCSVRCGDAGHLGSLLTVAVTATTADHDERALLRANLVDRLQHILQRIGRMGVIDHTDHTPPRADALETTAHGLQQAQCRQHLLLLKAQLDSRSIHDQEVRGVETTRQRGPHLAPVQLQQHPVEVHLHDLATVVGHRAKRVVFHLGAAVLHHHRTVPIVPVREGKGALGQGIEEALLGLQVVGKGLVIVEVIVREIRKEASRKVQSVGAALHDGVRRTLHKAVVTPRIDHLAQHLVQANRVGGRMGRGDLPVVNLIDHRRDQSCTVAQLAHQLIEERSGSGLAVRAGDAHQLQLTARIAVEGRGHAGHRLLAILHHDIGHAGVYLRRQLLAHHSHSALLQGHRDKAVTIRRRTAHGKEATACNHAA